jgi:hypothetical protein
MFKDLSFLFAFTIVVGFANYLGWFAFIVFYLIIIMSYGVFWRFNHYVMASSFSFIGAWFIFNYYANYYFDSEIYISLFLI